MATGTPYAELFGVAPQWVGLDGTHSGLTPLGPPRPLLDSQLDVPMATQIEIEDYQRFMLRGFTAQMLLDIDAITNRELNPTDLNVPLHPLLERQRWMEFTDEYLQTLPPNYIPTRADQYSASIDSVWNVMLPSLRLVSVILTNIHSHPWVCHMLG